MKFSILKIK